jgi:hypothetical protein
MTSIYREIITNALEKYKINEYCYNNKYLVFINIVGGVVFRFCSCIDKNELDIIADLSVQVIKKIDEHKILEDMQNFKNYIASSVYTCFSFMIENNRTSQNLTLPEPSGFIIIQKIETNDYEKITERFIFDIEFVNSENLTKEQIDKSKKQNGPELIEHMDLTLEEFKKYSNEKNK